MLVRSELYYKVAIAICAASTGAGLITGLMGAWWGFLQLIVSAAIGLSFYRNLRKLQALPESGETTDRPTLIFDQTDEQHVPNRQREELRDELRRIGISDDDLKIRSTIFGTSFEPKTPDAREKLADFLSQRHESEHEGESNDSADK